MVAIEKKTKAKMAYGGTRHNYGSSVKNLPPSCWLARARKPQMVGGSNGKPRTCHL